MKTIAQRELRNQISRILREVEAGERFQVTVNGRPVAELRPIEEGYPRTFVPRALIEKMLREAPLDPEFLDDVRGAIDDTVKDRW